MNLARVFSQDEAESFWRKQPIRLSAHFGWRFYENPDNEAGPLVAYHEQSRVLGITHHADIFACVGELTSQPWRQHGLAVVAGAGDR